MSEGGKKFSELPKKLSFLNKPMPKIFSSIDTRQDEDSGEGANLSGVQDSVCCQCANVPGWRPAPPQQSVSKQFAFNYST